jgi:hypothetical protein
MKGHIAVVSAQRINRTQHLRCQFQCKLSSTKHLHDLKRHIRWCLPRGMSPGLLQGTQHGHKLPNPLVAVARDPRLSWSTCRHYLCQTQSCKRTSRSKWLLQRVIVDVNAKFSFDYAQTCSPSEGHKDFVRRSNNDCFCSKECRTMSILNIV